MNRKKRNLIYIKEKRVNDDFLKDILTLEINLRKLKANEV